MIISNNNGGIHNSMEGFYNVQVVNEQDEIISDYGWNKNLILNTGMSQISGTYLGALTLNATIGTGSRANKITSSNSTITQSGNIITLWPEPYGLQNFSSSVISGSEVHYSSSLQIGDVIVYANASQSNVIAIDTVNGLTASVDTSYTIESGSNQTFTIWKTSQRYLHKYKSQYSSYYTLTGGCGTTDSTGSNGVANVRTFRRMYEFPLEVARQTYTEAGVNRYGPTWEYFSRMVFPSPITIDVGYKLRLTHHLRITFTPEIPRYFTASISGWPVAPSTNTICTESIQKFHTSRVDYNGSNVYVPSVLDPFQINQNYCLPFTSNSTKSLATFNQAFTRTMTSPGWPSWPDVTLITTTNNFECYKKTTFDINSIADAYTSSINSIGMGAGNPYSGESPNYETHQAYCMVFNQPQYKDNTQELTLVWRFSWTRILGE